MAYHRHRLLWLVMSLLSFRQGGKTPLMEAVLSSSVPVIEYLLEQRADCRAADRVRVVMLIR